MLLLRGVFRLPVSTGECAEQKASVRRDRSHYHEPFGRLPQLSVHSAADGWFADSHGREADECPFSEKSIQCCKPVTFLSTLDSFIHSSTVLFEGWWWQMTIPLCCISRSFLLPYRHLATSEMWRWYGGRGMLRKLSLCYSIVYHYSGAQRYEQFLQLGELFQDLILLGLPLLLRSTCVTSDLMVLCIVKIIFAYILFFTF